MTDKQIAARAVQIAARIMHRAGLCRYDDATKCRKVLLPSEHDTLRCMKRFLIGETPSERDCIGCIKRFLIGKAKKELEREEQGNDGRKGTD